MEEQEERDIVMRREESVVRCVVSGGFIRTLGHSGRPGIKQQNADGMDLDRTGLQQHRNICC